MSKTTNLLLNVWRELNDRFNHTELAENWDRIDTHDHAPGRGVQISTQGIGARQIINQHIAPGAIQDNVIADRSVKSQKIDYQGVRTENIAEGNVTSTKMGQFSSVRVERRGAVVLLPFTGGTAGVDIPFDRTIWDGMSSVVGFGANASHWVPEDPTFVHILETGLYAISGHVAIAPSTVPQNTNGGMISVGGGIREIRIEDAEGHSYARASSYGRVDQDTVSLSAATFTYLQAGHRLKLQVYQNQTYVTVGDSTAPRVIIAPDYSPQLSIVWLGPAPPLTS
jgi:hypothetical protein